MSYRTAKNPVATKESRGERFRVLQLVLIMILVSVGVGSASLIQLYQEVMREQNHRLQEIVHLQQRFITAFSERLGEGAELQVAEVVSDAYKNFEWTTKTGEFVVAMRQGDQVEFLLGVSREGIRIPPSVGYSSGLAMPMLEALKGSTGTLTGLDHRGTTVLAAYAPAVIGVGEKSLAIGLVAKLDLDEVRHPFIVAGAVAGVVATIMILIGTFLFTRINRTILMRITESQARSQAVVDMAPNAIVTVDQSGLVRSINLAAVDMFGHDQESVQLMSVDQLISFPPGHSEQGPVLPGLLDGEFEAHRKDGTTFPVAVQTRPVSIGERPLWVSIVQDITERKALEAMRQEMQANLEQKVAESTAVIGDMQQESQLERTRLQYLIDNNPGVIYTCVPSLDFRMIFVSENAEQLFGYTPKEMLSDPEFWVEHIHDDDLMQVIEQLPSLPEQGQQVHEYRFRHKDGRYLWVHDNMRLTRDDDGEPLEVVGSLTEITAQKEVEEVLIREKAQQQALIDKLEQAQSQLMQSEKLASIGQLAAGVAHEINNPVGYISSNLSSLHRYADNLVDLLDIYESDETSVTRNKEVDDLLEQARERADMEFLKEDLSTLLTESQEGIDRVKQIVRDLKDFSHPDEGEWQFTDLHHGLESTLNIAHNEIKYKAEVVRQYGELPDVECIPSQINQVFMNLLVNAAQAIDKSGSITLASGVEGEQVWITVADTGKGIPAEDAGRIFDPFYTTKPVGSGTGLGLSLSYGIIKKHGGSIQVASEEGVGTTFRVSLPIKHQDIEGEAA